MRANVKYSFYIGDELLILSDEVVGSGSDIIGWTVHKLERTLDLSAVYYQGGALKDMHPEQELHPGDKILVLASLNTLRRLNELNRAAGR